MNVDRREPNGAVNNEAPNGQSVYITTAGSKTCFMYSKLVELVVNSILRPNEFYVFGMDYRVPVRYGLITQAKIDDQRLSSTYSSEAFARESMSINLSRWTLKLFNCWELLAGQSAAKFANQQKRSTTIPSGSSAKWYEKATVIFNNDMVCSCAKTQAPWIELNELY